jgi:hypothetical protein
MRDERARVDAQSQLYNLVYATMRAAGELLRLEEQKTKQMQKEWIVAVSRQTEKMQEATEYIQQCLDEWGQKEHTRVPEAVPPT